jgi:hypothetical protein
VPFLDRQFSQNFLLRAHIPFQCDFFYSFLFRETNSKLVSLNYCLLFRKQV